jgi:HlyD family secretion protein
MRPTPRGGTPARAALLATAGAVLLSACALNVLPGGGGLGAAPPAEPTIAPQTSSQLSRPTVQVRRGTVTDSIKVLGKVISSQQSDLFFRTSSRLRAVNVLTGQQVSAGDVLAELETGDLTTKIAQQQAAVGGARLKLDQSKAKTVLDDSALEQQAVDQAQINLDQARVTLEKVKSGTLEADLQAAEAGQAQAQANLEKAKGDLAGKEADLAAKQADLDYKLAGPAPADLAKAQADVDAARIKLQQASNPPRPEDVQAAQLKLEQARNRLNQLRDSPPVKPEDVANAQVAVQQAEVTLDQAQGASATTPGQGAQKAANVRLAQLTLEKAKNDLNKLKEQQNSAWDVRLAELDVAAQEQALAKLQNPQPYDARTAQVAYDLAQGKLALLQKGPTDQVLTDLKSQISSLQLAVESAKTVIPSAEAAAAAAQAALDAKRQGATDLDVQDAQNKVDKAQSDLDTARAKLDVKRTTLGQATSAAQYDVQTAEKEVQKQQLELQRLQANYDDARILAPYDGKITRVNGKPGDSVQAFTPVISIASPAQLLVQAQISESVMPKLAVGERALITLDASPTQVFNGTVRDLPSSVVTQQGVVADKNTTLTVDWTAPGAEMGMLARVQIIVQQKDDVLIVPSNAVRTVGKRRFVEYMDGNVKRSRNVETGVSTDTDTEIVSGLDEGMTILAGA